MRTRITFVGDDYWTTQLANGLNARYSRRVRCHAALLNVGFLRAIAGLCRLLRADVVVRVGFPPHNLEYEPYDEEQYIHRPGIRESVKRIVFRSVAGRELRKWVHYVRLGARRPWRPMFDGIQIWSRRLRQHRREFMYWIGTDVLQALEVLSTGSRAAYLHKLAPYHHMSVAPHLSDELRLAGIVAPVVAFPKPVPHAPDPLPAFPDQFTVLAYLPANSFDFYGGPTILQAARRLPSVRFVAFGGVQPAHIAAPRNVKFVGHISDMKTLYSESTVLVRLTRHDGSPSTLAEALVMGRIVIHSFAHPYTILVECGDVDSLVAELERMIDMHESGGLAPDSEAAHWAAVEYDPDRCFHALLEHLVPPPY